MLGGITIVISDLHAFASICGDAFQCLVKWTDSNSNILPYSIIPLGPEQWISMALKESAFAAVRLLRKNAHVTGSETLGVSIFFCFFRSSWLGIVLKFDFQWGCWRWIADVKVVARCWFELIFWCLNALMKLDVWWLWRPSETIVLLEWLHGTGW